MRMSTRSRLLSTALRITGALAVLAACVTAIVILAGPWGMLIVNDEPATRAG